MISFTMFFLVVFLILIIVVIFFGNRHALFRPIVELYIDIGVMYLVLVFYLYLSNTNQTSMTDIMDYISIYILLWIISYSLVFYWKTKKYPFMVSVSQLELNGLIWGSTTYAFFLRLMASPLFSMVIFYFLRDKQDLAYTSDVVFGSVVFSATIGLTLIERNIISLDDYPRLLIERAIYRNTSKLLSIKNHIVIGGYGNIGQNLARRILQMARYSPMLDSTKNLETQFLWLVQKGKFKLERLFLHLTILDRDTDRWDYVFPHTIFKYAGIEKISPALGESVYVPIIGSDLKSDHIWNALNFNESKSVIQTFENKETETYLLQKNTKAPIVVRSSSSTTYSEITERDRIGRILRFYPAFELGTLFMRRIYAAVMDALNDTTSSILLIFIGKGPELYYALKSWMKILPKISEGVPEADKKIKKLIITDDPIFKAMARPLISLNKTNETLSFLLNGTHLEDNVYIYYLPMRHSGPVKIPLVYYPLELVYAVLRECSKYWNKQKQKGNSSFVPILVVVGKEGLSESLAKEVFRIIPDLDTNKYHIIVPYFYRDEFYHILESAKSFKVNLGNLHLFHPYKEIQEGVSNYVLW